MPTRALSVFAVVVCLATLACGGGGSGGNGASTQPVTVAVTVSPASATVIVGQTQQFTANVSTDWSVNGVTGGNSTVGTVDISGLYTAPAAVPNPAAVTVKACSRTHATNCGTATVTITAPPPPPQKIAFTYTTSDGARNIWSINPNGTGLQQLTSTPYGQGSNFQPSFSSDGKKIAYWKETAQTDTIWIMNGDGSNPQVLDNGLSFSNYPAWSPDGTNLAYIYLDNNETGVAVTDLSTHATKKLTTESCPTGGCKIPGRPSWSPDGTKIAYDDPKTGNWDIYVMNPDGTALST